MLALFRQVTVGKKHVHKADGDNVTIRDGRGNSRAYTLDRLQRERPDLFAALSLHRDARRGLGLARRARCPLAVFPLKGWMRGRTDTAWGRTPGHTGHTDTL